MSSLSFPRELRGTYMLGIDHILLKWLITSAYPTYFETR
jgi:hypothetical protein